MERSARGRSQKGCGGPTLAASWGSMELVELVVRAMQGDREAFSAIVQLTHARLYRTACLILRDPDLAADAVQDAFVSAWVDAKAIRDPARFEAWLNRLLVR